MKKKILITGINGFLGSHLAKYLKSSFEVLGLEYSLNNLFRIKSENFKVYDVISKPLENIFIENEFYAVIHVATIYRRKLEPLKNLLKTNVLLPVNLLELSNKHGVSLFLNTDSFFNNSSYSYSYLSDYTLSKKHSVDWIKLLSNSSLCKIVNMKIFHMFGENDSPSKFIPYLIDKILRNEKSIDMTPGLQTRDFIYVNDVISAFETVLKNEEKLINYQEYEVGSGNSFSIKHLADLIKKISKSKTQLNFGAISYRKGEIMESVCNNKKLIELGWTSKFSLNEGLSKIIKNLNN